MTSSTKWMVAIFAVVATFAAGMFLAEAVNNELNPRNISASFDGHPEGDTGTTTSGQLTLPEPAQGAVGVPKPLPQAGGNNLLLNPGGGNVGIGTFTPTEQLEITGNFRLPVSTATTGIIMSGASPFIHNFGTDNFFAGFLAGNLTMTGSSNTGVGAQALDSNTTGFNNTATGRFALFRNTTGASNVAAGQLALFSNTTGFDNTAVGTQALFSNTTATNNIAIGGEALFDNTIGLANTAVGIDALHNNTIGNANTAAGKNALLSNTTGNFNTALGTQADVSVGNLTNATAIGSNAIVDASNKIRLGDSNVTVIEAPVGITAVSDVNLKENFLAVDGKEMLEKIRELKLESWNFKGHDPRQFRHYGPTAQEFFAAFGHDSIGSIGTDTTINSGDMAGIMMVAIQELAEQNAALQQRINDLETRIK